MNRLFGLYSYSKTTPEFAFRTLREATNYAEMNPRTVHHAGGTTTIEFYQVDEFITPSVVHCKSCKVRGINTIVTAPDPKKYSYCKMCYYTGQAGEHQMAATILKLNRRIKRGDAHVWHTGGGCFSLTVSMPDGTYYSMTGDDMECETIPTEGIGCLCRSKDAEETGEFGEGGTWQALVYEGYTSYDGEGDCVKISLDDAIDLIKADIKTPAIAELV